MDSSLKSVAIGTLRGTPVGQILVAVGENGLQAVGIRTTEAEFRQRAAPNDDNVILTHDPAKTSGWLAQLQAYLDGTRRDFDLPIDWSVMTDFQRTALRRVHAIPYGQTRTYSGIAAEIGKPKASRAVGRANATNPMPIVVPCHRVIGRDQSLRGYLGGIDIKEALLRLEGAPITTQLTLF